jgi:nucleotide-binding universal stress UspA family protein
MLTHVLVPLDGSKTAEKVLPYARFIADALNIPIELLAIVDVASIATQVASQSAKYIDAIILEGERHGSLYLEKIVDEFPGFAAKTIVRRGKPAETIIETAATDKGTLITMATHGRSGIKRWLLGSVAEKVLRGTANPLLLVRANEKPELRQGAAVQTITVPLDGSQLAASVLPLATTIAKQMNVGIILFRAYELPASAYYGSEDYLPNYEELKSSLSKQVETYLAKEIETLKNHGVEKASFFLTEGAGPDEIISYARKRPDTLIVMCTHGRSGMKRWVLGSVTEKVVRHSGNPVLVMRAA